MVPAVERTQEQTRIPTKKIVLYVAFASIMMMFAGLTSGYILRWSEGNWDAFAIPSAFYISTGIIIASSLSMWWAQQAAKKNQLQNIKSWMTVTSVLGLSFVISQYVGYGQLVNMGVYFSGGNISGSFFYVITALHAAHVLGGIIALLVTTGKSYFGKYSSDNRLGIQLCANYWHFMGFLWLFLFVFLAVTR